MKYEWNPWGAAGAVTAIGALVLYMFLAAAEGAVGAAPTLLWATYGNTALAGSALLYAAYLRLRAESVGRAASLLATCGAAGLFWGLSLGQFGAQFGRIGLYEGTAMLTLFAIVAYLAIEQAYDNRGAGALVMAAVMLAVLCEMWLIAHDHAATARIDGGLGVYWTAGQRFAISLGYCALALGAALAPFAAARAHRGIRAPSALAVLAALAAGASLLLLGSGMGTIAALTGAGPPLRVGAEAALGALIAVLAAATWRALCGQAAQRLARGAITLHLAASAGLLAAGWAGVVPG